MKDTVVVQIRWGDPWRPGLRTLAVENASIDDVFRTLTAVFSRSDGRTRSLTRVADTGRARGQGRRRAEPAPEAMESAANGSGRVVWARELRGGTAGERGTLVQIEMGGKTLSSSVRRAPCLSSGLARRGRGRPG
ncbi:MAG: hypothetical protein KatS3mg076_3036 [Candidatus Binatia bacterium]|nr:MAG: hypothetical protein KatS3mg076_3036 [Candidatus Binatia bacterium]